MNLAQFAEHLGVTRQAVSQAALRGDLEGVLVWRENIEGQRLATIPDVDRAVLLWRTRHRAPALPIPKPPKRPRGRPPKVRPPQPAPTIPPPTPDAVSVLSPPEPAPAQPPPQPVEQPTPVPDPVYLPTQETIEFEEQIPAGDPLTDIAVARLQYEGYRALKEKLEYEEACGKLIAVETVKEIFGRQIAEAKNAIMALGKHARSRIPHLSIDDVVTIEELCREALEGLSVGTSDT